MHFIWIKRETEHKKEHIFRCWIKFINQCPASNRTQDRNTTRSQLYSSVDCRGFGLVIKVQTHLSPKLISLFTSLYFSFGIFFISKKTISIIIRF